MDDQVLLLVSWRGKGGLRGGLDPGLETTVFWMRRGRTFPEAFGSTSSDGARLKVEPALRKPSGYSKSRHERAAGLCKWLMAYMARKLRVSQTAGDQQNQSRVRRGM